MFVPDVIPLNGGQTLKRILFSYYDVRGDRLCFPAIIIYNIIIRRSSNRVQAAAFGYLLSVFFLILLGVDIPYTTSR